MIIHRVLSLIFFVTVSLHSFHKVLFTPRDDIKTYLIELIDQERISIHAAVYMFTDKVMAQALLNAFVRGVKIFLIFDQISMGEKYGKGLYLQERGISILVHQPARLGSFFCPIMHHKFFIFGYNACHRCSLVWTGSFNCTASASRLHDENVIITDNVEVVKEYQQCFVMLSKRLQGSS